MNTNGRHNASEGIIERSSILFAYCELRQRNDGFGAHELGNMTLPDYDDSYGDPERFAERLAAALAYLHFEAKNAGFVRSADALDALIKDVAVDLNSITKS